MLSKALVITYNDYMKKVTTLQRQKYVSTLEWAGTADLFPGDQLKWTIAIFSFVNNCLKGERKSEKQK